jgi:hypothetical protein
MILAIASEFESDWIYRVFDRRIISVKAKNDHIHKIAAIDLLTNLAFSIDVTKEVPMTNFEVEKTYFARIKVYVAREIQGIAPEHTNFFKVLDENQTVDDFIKAYWLYPKLIKFQLAEAESIQT